jgi:hypothetical protein
VLLDTAVGVFLKEGIAFLTGNLKGLSASRKSVARHFYALYRHLEEVQEAYRFSIEEDRDETSLLKYDRKLFEFAQAVREVEHILNIYDNQVYETLRKYSDMGGQLDPGEAIIRELRWKHIDNSEFYDAKDSLARFIRDNFKMQDLVG